MVLEKAIEKYGPEHQTIVAIEELSELQKELTKALRGKLNEQHLMEEIADVEIMLEQIRMIYKLDPLAMYNEKLRKMDRLGVMLNE